MVLNYFLPTKKLAMYSAFIIMLVRLSEICVTQMRLIGYKLGKERKVLNFKLKK